jgi:hypothetical protein
MAKKKALPPQLKAYSSCVKELGINPQMMKKGVKGAAETKGKLHACAIKKLKAMGITPKKK